MKKRFLSTLLASLVVFQAATISASAETVKISIVEKPNVDILLTTGDFTSDLKNFEKDITDALKKDGINTSGINFQTIQLTYLFLLSLNYLIFIQLFNFSLRIYSLISIGFLFLNVLIALSVTTL